MEDTVVVPRVVAAVMTCVHSEHHPEFAAFIEQAQTKAVEQALAEGVSIYDSEEIVRRKQAVFEDIKRKVGVFLGY